MFIVSSAISPQRQNGICIVRVSSRVSSIVLWCTAKVPFQWNTFQLLVPLFISFLPFPFHWPYIAIARVPCSGSVNVLAIASQLCRYLSVSINADECMRVCSPRVCMNVLLFLSACLPYNSRNNNKNNSDNKDGKFAAIGIFYAFAVFCCMLLGVAFWKV